MRKNDPKVIANLINCLSALENNTSLLYKALVDRIELPLVKSLIHTLVQDSQKHSTILKSISETLSKKSEKPRDCEKNIGEAWRNVDNLHKEIAGREKLTEQELSQLLEKLAILESIIGEEYYIFVQLKTLTLMVNEIKQIYAIDLGSLKGIFGGIINDEERHREILETVKGMLESKQKASNPPPLVRYQHPDSWATPMPPTS